MEASQARQAYWRKDLNLTQFARATLVGSFARGVLEGYNGEVLSVFERTLDVLSKDKLIGIARKGVTPSPINVITDISRDRRMTSLGIEKGMSVKRSDNLLIIDDTLEISLKDAEVWRPRTGVDGYFDFEISGRNLDLAKRLAVEKGESEGLAQLLPWVDDIAMANLPEVSNLNQVAEKALPNLTNLIECIRAGDLDCLKKQSKSLIGLGPGLTPSADDLLSGLMVARWWVANSLGTILEKVKAANGVIIESSDRTTLMAQHLLNLSAKGKTNEAVEDLLKAILAGTAAEVETGVDRVSEIGETSGFDTMVGLFLGLEVSLERL